MYLKVTGIDFFPSATICFPLKPHRGYTASCSLSSGSSICLKAFAKMMSVALHVSSRTLWTRNPLMIQDMT
jgi:hypothetical protein